jgi:hypothetical protein
MSPLKIFSEIMSVVCYVYVFWPNETNNESFPMMSLIGISCWDLMKWKQNFPDNDKIDAGHSQHSFISSSPQDERREESWNTHQHEIKKNI